VVLGGAVALVTGGNGGLGQPGEQFVIRRQAYAMIKKAFDENGIKFAFPTVQVAGEGEPATAAVAQRALELTKPAAA
jgi:moderate conductance mechanosensitive channel